MTDTIFGGAQGEIYYSSLSIIVMTIMFMLAIRLLISRQKRAYLTLTICMGIMLVGQFILLGAGLFNNEVGTNIHSLLNMVTFILANMSVYQLFGETNKRVMNTVYVLLVGSLLLSFVPLAANLYSMVLVGLAFFILKPVMERGRKYQVGLTMYGIAVVSHIINSDILEKQVIVLHILDNLLRIGFFIVLFLILFDRVMELMENSYNKSTRDALTGLYNRFYFYTSVSFILNEKQPISIVFKRPKKTIPKSISSNNRVFRERKLYGSGYCFEFGKRVFNSGIIKYLFFPCFFRVIA